MNIFINSPVYFTSKYGVIDDIYKFCSYIAHNMDISKYTSAIETVAITPIIAPEEFQPNKFRKQILFIGDSADISIPTNFEAYYFADSEGKKKLIAENIINSVTILKKRLKSQFNLEMFLRDIENLISNYRS